jgi:FAD synthase
VAFVARLRDEQTFTSPEALVRQIEQDVHKAKEALQAQ